MLTIPNTAAAPVAASAALRVLLDLSSEIATVNSPPPRLKRKVTRSMPSSVSRSSEGRIKTIAIATIVIATMLSDGASNATSIAATITIAPIQAGRFREDRARVPSARFSLSPVMSFESSCSAGLVAASSVANMPAAIAITTVCGSTMR